MSRRSMSAGANARTMVIKFAKDFTVAKQVLVKLWFAKSRVNYYISAYVLWFLRPAASFVAVVVGGLWNAFLLRSTRNPSDSIAIGHVAKHGCADVAKFAARLAAAVSTAEGATAANFDLVLLVEEDVSITKYLTIARFFNKQVNLNVVRSIDAYERIVPAIVVPDKVEELRNMVRESQSRGSRFVIPSTVGSFRPPPLYASLARDFYKTIDGRKSYCLICLHPEWQFDVLEKTAQTLVSKHRDWRFVVVEEDWRGKIANSTTTNLISPSCAGLDFGTQVSLAAEADAFIGPPGVFALASVLSGKPVTLIESDEESFKVSSELRNVRMLRDFDIRGLANEITLLVERANCIEPIVKENRELKIA
jgi:hypothetical protein